MVEAWVWELGQAIINLIYQPLFYWAILLIFLTAYYRRKKERKNFGAAVYPIGSELKYTWLLSLIGGIVISIALIMIGGVVSFPVVTAVAVTIIILTITGSLVLLSPAYSFGIVILFFWLVPYIDLTVFPAHWVSDWKNVNLALLLFLLAGYLLLESILLFTAKNERGFPLLYKGKRGKFVGAHALKRLLIIPIFLPVPNGMIDALAPWWPLFPLGDGEGYSLLLFPMIIGVKQVFQGMFANDGGRLLGTWTLILVFVTALLAYGGLFFPILLPIGAVVAIFGRLMITLSVRFKDMEKPIIFTPQPDGILVLSVIPNTPAEKMGLQVGEKIIKVHQHPVANEQEFYDALQENRTFCKLEVRTIEGEIRFVQGPMYEGEHYELGLVFVKEKPRFRLYNMNNRINQ